MKTTEDELKDLIYAALLGETTWHHFLDRLAKAVPDGKAALVMHDTAQNAGYAVFGGGQPGLSDQYSARYASLNPLQPPLALKRVGVSAFDDELYPREALIRTEFFNDFLLPNGMAYSAGAKIAKVGSRSFTLVTLCGGTDSEPNRQSPRMLTRLAPHLKRAFDHYRRGPSIQAASTSGSEVLDAIHVGVIVINDERRIKVISTAGQAMLVSLSPVRISAEGRVRFRRMDIQAACEQMLRRDYNGARVMAFLSHQTKLTLVHVNRDAASLYFEGPTVIVLMEQRDGRSTRHDLQLFSDAYKLSRGEARALSGIVAGKSAEQIAAEASLSRETIRSQMKSLYAKTGAAGAADVLRLVHRRYLV